MTENLKVQMVKKHYLFSSLGEEEAAQLATGTRIVEMDAGQNLFFQGEKADHFYFVNKGQIKLTRLTPDGNEKVIEILMPGQTFAEAVVFMKKDSYPVTATAITDSEVVSFQSKLFLSIVRNNNDLCLELLGDLSLRLRNRLQEIENLTMKNATYRVVRYFINQLDELGPEETTLELPIQKQLIASRLSIKPETLSRILHHLKEDGIIETHGKTIKIVNIERLKAYE